ncbi:MAG: FHA domain-containing protein, partial [Clostridiales bacterium]|nr:FHA domain-containing protein [Clostridiales bacterium]
MSAAAIIQTILQGLQTIGRGIASFFASLSGNEVFMSLLTTLLGGAFHYVMPFLGVLVVVRCGRSLFQSRMEQETWGSLVLTDGTRLPLNHWENLVGRSRRCDVILSFGTVSRNHAALIRDSKGNWLLYALNSKNGVTLNGTTVFQTAALKARDIISFGGVDACFLPATTEEERQQAQR